MTQTLYVQFMYFYRNSFGKQYFLKQRTVAKSLDIIHVFHLTRFDRLFGEIEVIEG